MTANGSGFAYTRATVPVSAQCAQRHGHRVACHLPRRAARL